MKGMIKIENLTGRHKQFRIDHQQVCVKTGQCLCRQGRRSVEALTIHVAGNSTTGFLPPSVAMSAEIKAAASGNRPQIKIHGAAPQAKAKDKKTGTKGGQAGGSKGGTGRKGQSNKSGKTK